MPKTRTRKAAARPSRKKRLTVHDVAAAAGVSISTVSYVLNRRGSIGEETRQRVLKAAKKLGYRQNRAARAMKTGRSDIIGLVFPNIENPFFAALAQSVLLEAQRNDYQVFLVDTEGSYESEKRAVHGLMQQGVDGIIVFPVDDSDTFSDSGIDVPVVVLDRDLPNRDLVQAEYYEGGRLVAGYLQELGHRQFGLLEGPQAVASARERSQGFIDALAKKTMLKWRHEQSFSMELSPKAHAQLHKNVTAVVCGNDLIAIGAMLALQSRRIAVPEQISVVGFDDINFASRVTPALTTVRMPTAEMGVEAVSLLKRRMTSGTETAARSRVVLNVELVVRDSTSPPGG